MKKLLCLSLALVLCLMSCTAFAAKVPMTSTNLPAMPRCPAAPQIIRVQQIDDALILTLDQALPSESLVTALGLDSELRIVSVNAAPGADNTYSAAGLPAGGQWNGVEIAWVSGDVNALARYDVGGGLVSTTCFDKDFNEYIYDYNGKFVEFAYASTGVRARFDDSGKMTSYGYEALKNTIVWFNREASLLRAEYNDGAFAASWDPTSKWYVQTASGRVSVKLNVNPWNTSPLLKPEEKDEEEEEVKTTWYPKNTISVAGLKLQEASPNLPDKWYNVLPIDLTREGRQTYFLLISHMHYIGKCHVDVWDGEVTVSCTLMDNPSIEYLSSYGRWFTNLSQITETSIESEENGFVFGQPVNIEEELGGADVALLFIRSKATYCLPFRDGGTMTRYWRNTPEWKEFREELQELMPLVEK